MRAKIKFPIRWKLLLLMSALVIASIITYLTLAIKLFRDDKTTLIFDLNASIVRTISSEFRSDLTRYSKTVKLLAQGYQNSEWLRVLLADERELLGFRLYEAGTDAASGAPLLTAIHTLERDREFLEEKEITAADWAAWTSSVNPPAELLEATPGKTTWLTSKFITPNAPVIAYAESVRFETAARPRILVGFFRADRWWMTLKNQGIVTPFLADAAGNVLLHPDPQVLAQPSFSANPLVLAAVGSTLPLELKSFEWNGKGFLGGYADVGGGLKVISMAPESEIFRASMRLVNKSLLFGLLIVTIALLLSSRVANSLTRPISELVLATESIGQGRFEPSLAVSSRDEVGELSRAFNAMAGDLDRLQGQLVESERHAAIGQVARGVGHEFGNILMRVFGKIDLALYDTQEPKTRAHLETAMTALERAKIILQNLRSYSKTGTEHPKSLVDLGEVFDQTLTLMQHELKTGNVEVVREYADAPKVLADPVTLGQVFLNLSINAKQAMSKGGTLTVSIAARDREGRPGVTLQVRDTGTGIPAEVLPKIFETAFSTKGEQGSGLGLAISRSIVESHGGTIDAVSGSAGATFTIWLPSDERGARPS